mgnify:CR=1 FL=1
MREKFFKHRKEHNGGHSYEAFNLSDDMTHHSGLYDKNGVFTIMDSSKSVEDTQLTRLRWKRVRGWKKSAKPWQNECEWTKYDPTEIIFLPEFLNRYSFVSSFAWLINTFVSEKKLQRHHAIQLLYVALLTPSQMQFQFVVRQLMKEYTPEKNLCFEYINHCKDNGLCANGGPKPRFMVGKDTELPENSDEIEENVAKVEKAIDSLNNGKMLDNSGVFVDNKDVLDVKGIGSARAISFPSLCCFTGLGTTTAAIQTAKQAILNSETGNGYAGDRPGKLSKLGTELKLEEGDSSPYSNQYYRSILEAAGMSVGEVLSTMENAACAITRGTPRCDMFIKGQTLYCLFLDRSALDLHGGCGKSKVRSTVYQKRYGEKNWTVADLPQWTT